MPCHMDVIDANCKVLVQASAKLQSSMFGQFTGVETVASKQHGSTWLYALISAIPRQFQDLADGLTHLEGHFLNANNVHESLFIPFSDDPDDIMCLGGHRLFDSIINNNGEFLQGTIIWRMSETRPPRKRAQEEDVTMLIPGLKRLSHQLHVDFAVNVHGTDGKRKREPVRSIYEEAVAQGKKRQPYQRKAQITPRKRMQQQQIDSPEISEIDEAEMLRHAEVLASLRRDEVHEPRSPVSKHTANMAGIIETLTKAMETVNTVHDQAIASKDEIIRTLHTATAAKDDTIRTKDEIISALNAASVAKEDAAIENLRMKDEIICMQAALIATLQTLG